MNKFIERVMIALLALLFLAGLSAAASYMVVEKSFCAGGVFVIGLLAGLFLALFLWKGDR